MNLAPLLLRPIPLALYQPAFRRIVRHVAQAHPHLFARMGEHRKKTFLLCPTNMPFVLLLRPDPDNLELTAHRSGDGLSYQASLSGSFLSFLRMLDGSTDGDALFFSRTLRIEGDTEAIVCLRNALDDIEGNLVEEIAGLYGRPGRLGLSLLRRIGQ